MVDPVKAKREQTLAESSQRLSEDIKAQYPVVDWKGLAGFRNVLVHQEKTP